MEEHQLIAAIAPNPRCTVCGYSREGLDLLQRCPECGFAPPHDEIVIWGFGATIEDAHRSRLMAALIVPNIGLALLLINTIRSANILLIAGTLLLIALLNAWFLFVRKRNLSSFQTPAVAIFNRDGCGQRAGPGEVELLAWKSVKEIQLLHKMGVLTVRCRLGWIANAVDIEIRPPQLDEARLHSQLKDWHRASSKKR